jgi:hypothetical protein
MPAIKDYSCTRFIKISNNNYPLEFHIDITTMKSDRLRMASLKSQWLRYLEHPDDYPNRDVFKFFTLDYSFYTLDTGSFNNYDECKAHRDKLVAEQKEKLKNTERPTNDKIIRLN